MAIDSPTIPPQVTGLHLLRLGYWKHHARNRRLARLANAIGTYDLAWLAEYAPRVADWLASRQLNHPPRVAVVAHTVDHVVALAEHLRDWTVITDGDTANEPMLRRLQNRPRSWNLLGCLVTTTSGFDQVEIGGLDVIVFAGGGAFLPPLPRHKLICPAGDPRRLLVVDADDHHQPQLCRWSRSRRIAYLDAGWCPVGADAQRVRVDAFFRRRPRNKR